MPISLVVSTQPTSPAPSRWPGTLLAGVARLRGRGRRLDADRPRWRREPSTTSGCWPTDRLPRGGGARGGDGPADGTRRAQAGVVVRRRGAGALPRRHRHRGRLVAARPRPLPGLADVVLRRVLPGVLRGGLVLHPGPGRACALGRVWRSTSSSSRSASARRSGSSSSGRRRRRRMWSSSRKRSARPTLRSIARSSSRSACCC